MERPSVPAVVERARQVLAIVADDRSERFRTDADAPWWWADEKRFARSEVGQRLDPRNLNAQFPQPLRDLPGMRDSFERNVLPLVTGHPKTEFDLVWPPYSIIVWADFVQRRQLEVSLAFKRYVFEATRGLANVHVIDLQGVADITHDLDRYTDLYHFDPAVNDWLIDAACNDRLRVRADNVDALERELRAQAQAFDPARLAQREPVPPVAAEPPPRAAADAEGRSAERGDLLRGRPQEPPRFADLQHVELFRLRVRAPAAAGPARPAARPAARR